MTDTAIALDDHRAGIGHLAEDPMHFGQPVHPIYSHADGEDHYWLQITHNGLPLWSCACCAKITLGSADGGTPARCLGCEHGTADDLGPVLYPIRAACHSWAASYGGQYDGPCLIPGADGCDCPEVSA